MQWTSHCVPWQIEFVGVLFGLRPRFCCVWFSVVCFAVSSGETQVWLGDLRVVVFVVFCGFCVVCFDLPAQNGHFLSLYKCLSGSLCSCKDRAFSATSAKLEEKKKVENRSCKRGCRCLFPVLQKARCFALTLLSPRGFDLPGTCNTSGSHGVKTDSV